MWCSLDAHRTRWLDGPAALCPGCLNLAADSIRAFPNDYVDLEQRLPAGAGAGERITGTRERRTPIALTVEALQRELWHQATIWEANTRGWLGLSEIPVGRTRDGYAIQRASTILADHVTAVAAIPSTPVVRADYFYEEITGADALIRMTVLHRRIKKCVGSIYSIPGTCPECEVDGGLQRGYVNDDVHCAVCHHVIPRSVYDRAIADCIPMVMTA